MKSISAYFWLRLKIHLFLQFLCGKAHISVSQNIIFECSRKLRGSMSHLCKVNCALIELMLEKISYHNIFRYLTVLFIPSSVLNLLTLMKLIWLQQITKLEGISMARLVDLIVGNWTCYSEVTGWNCYWTFCRPKEKLNQIIKFNQHGLSDKRLSSISLFICVFQIAETTVVFVMEIKQMDVNDAPLVTIWNQITHVQVNYSVTFESQF